MNQDQNHERQAYVDLFRFVVLLAASATVLYFILTEVVK